MRRPAYLHIADDLRELIGDGDLPPGARVPSRAELARRYRVSDRVAVEAVKVLVAEGLVEGRPGSGTYVRARPPVRALRRGTPRKPVPGSPFAADLAARGRRADWQAASETLRAAAEIAARLAIEPGEEVMRTDYVFTDDAEPALVATSWEPLSLTRSTEIRRPEEGPFGGTGVVDRMAAIGVTVTHATETVTARPVTEREARLLGVPLRATALAILRTYVAGRRPVETADLVVAADRYQVAYEFPVTPGDSGWT